MSVLIVGMSHRSAPVQVLEKLSMDDARRHAALQGLIARTSLNEAMIVSTCNRIEVYCVTSSFHSGVEDVICILAEIAGVAPEELRQFLYVRYADAAAEHMMLVASGLDSMVLGEQQIIGQVRRSYQEATDLDTLGPGLHALAQTALHTGKRVHSETGVDDSGASMVSLALDTAMSGRALDSLAGETALVLGAGAMSALAATELGRRGIGKLIIANRTLDRARRLASHAIEAGVASEAIPFDQRQRAMSQVSIVVSATGAGTYTVRAEDLPAGQPRVLIDLSMPRDIDPATAHLPGVDLINIETLQQSATSPTAGYRQDALDIVAEELEAFSSEQRVRNVAPAVTALRRHANELAAAELRRLSKRLPDMDEEQYVEVCNTVRRVVEKLLHQPTVKVKELAAAEGAVTYETALQELFGLPVPSRSVAVDASELPDRTMLNKKVGKDLSGA